MARRTFLGALLLVAGAGLASCGSSSQDGKTVRVTEGLAKEVRFTCPNRAFFESGPARLNVNPHSEDAMVPGEPDRLLLCRYWERNQPELPGTFASKRLLTAPGVVRSIAEELDGLEPFPNRALSCPSPGGPQILSFFHYPGEAPVVVEANYETCPIARNGRAASGRSSPALRRRLEKLVPLPTFGPRRAPTTPTSEALTPGMRAAHSGGA